MFPLFIAGDILSFNRSGPFHRGDVIVYRHPGAERYIIHRIISAREETVRTGSDTKPLPDPYILPVNEIIGKVTAVSRNGKEIRIPGGLSGYLWYLYLTRYHRQVCRLSGIIRPIYHAASHPPALRRLQHRWLQYHPHILIQADGSLVGIVFLRRWYAAWIHEQEGVWHIRTPFRLLIDESDLPDLHLMVREALISRTEQKKNQESKPESPVRTMWPGTD